MFNKKFFLIFFIIIILIGVFFVSKSSFFQNGNSSYQYQKIAWNSLNKEYQKQVVGSWKKAKVEKVHYDNDLSIFSIVDQSQINIKDKDLIKISFDSKDEQILGKIIIYIDPKTNKAIGIAPRM